MPLVIRDEYGVVEFNPLTGEQRIVDGQLLSRDDAEAVAGTLYAQRTPKQQAQHLRYLALNLTTYRAAHRY